MEDIILKLREEIDKTDNNILKLLEKRFQIVKKIISEKKKKNIQIEDLDREKRIVDDKIKRFKLKEDFIKDFYNLIFKESKKLKKDD